MTVCPNCQKREFKQYYDTHTGLALHSTCGRCNREENCGYHYPPRDYFNDYPTEKLGLRNIKRLSPVVTMPVKPIDYLPISLAESGVEQTLAGTRSVFLNWLLDLFDGNDTQRAVFNRLVKDYYLMSQGANGTVFWQVDSLHRLRTGQALCHHLKSDVEAGVVDCKRDHEQPPRWMHKYSDISTSFNMKQCLFGEHLLELNPDKIVALCEGQKNAVIGAGVAAQYVWVATCSKQNFKADMLGALKGRRVVIFPDLDAHDQWVEQAKVLSRRIGFTYDVFTGMVDCATADDYSRKLDIADYLLGKFEWNDQSSVPA